MAELKAGILPALVPSPRRPACCSCWAPLVWGMLLDLHRQWGLGTAGPDAGICHAQPRVSSAACPRAPRSFSMAEDPHRTGFGCCSPSHSPWPFLTWRASWGHCCRTACLGLLWHHRAKLPLVSGRNPCLFHYQNSDPSFTIQNALKSEPSHSLCSCCLGALGSARHPHCRSSMVSHSENPPNVLRLFTGCSH